MTAPDVNADVRARFEAWAKSQRYYVDRAAHGFYKSYRTHDAWEGYRAAHADLAGEVRDAKRWRAFISALRTRLPGSAHGTRIKVVEVCPMYGDEKEVSDITAVIDAALAKFQEKP